MGESELTPQERENEVEEDGMRLSEFTGGPGLDQHERRTEERLTETVEF